MLKTVTKINFSQNFNNFLITNSRYIFSFANLKSFNVKTFYSRHKKQQPEHDRYRCYKFFAAAVFGAACIYLNRNQLREILLFENGIHALRQKQITIAGVRREDLPTYSMKEVNEHDNLLNRIWVTYKEGVYDITNFVKKHPGGEGKIMMAAGGSIDPFWAIFANHTKIEILELLETMRIGNLKKEDIYRNDSENYDPYTLEPPRHKALKVNNQRPFCAEPPSDILVDNFLTPSEVFYVRNHLPVPMEHLENYNLELAIEDDTVKSLVVDDIKKYPKYTVTSAVMCGGNRRSEMASVKPLRGLSWGVAAVGNATWSGARLCDVLRDLGVNEENYNHVHLEGLDVDPSGTPYQVSIPISKAMDPRGDVLLAYEMNGEEIPIDHGFPIRAVVPGVVGARNVKWLAKVSLSKKESPGQFQQNDYKSFSPSVDWDTVDFSKAPAIQEMPVTSAICVPQNMGKVVVNKNGAITVKGYAWSGGGKKIIRVDVTKDQGKSWLTANLVAQDTEAKEGRHWAWTLWSLELPVDRYKEKEIEIWAKAVDAAYNVQPESFENIWNLRGVLGNAYHRIKVQLS